MGSRIFKLCNGSLIKELNATAAEVKSLERSIAKKTKGQKMMKSMLAHSRMCKNGCTQHAFDNFATCCTQCTGPEGPHTKDCQAKHEAVKEFQKMAAARATGTTPSCFGGCFAFLK